ncbi:YihY/virulence factor BrkB family protein [Tenacibaculum holothuriorum]|uniref:YihY/virulence factor BrkB family protein n=1 Tax=Tenacibaculum holothuriorum TaxID=1635173 RepID=UPI001302D921|nr:YihY/virulence factor BrkB family protein [Tenacibaculum holothuriorum]
MFKFLKQVFLHFFNSNTFQKGAALAYYAVFSIFPIIIILVSILGLIFGKEAISGEIYNQLQDVLGKEASIQIQAIIKNQHQNHNSVLTTIIGFSTLLLSASGMFGQIHNAFNGVWNLKAKPKNGLIRYFTKHFFSFSLLLLLFFILVISSSINSYLIQFYDSLHTNYKVVLTYEHLASFAVSTVLFSLMFLFLGDAKINFKPMILGGIFTAFLFSLGKIGISYYLGKSHLSTTFGTASILALIMLWVYYTSQILFLGASFVKIYSDFSNAPIQANDNAVLITEHEIS